jgi:hypothetical protein
MLIHSDTKLRDFEFWSGGADTANCLTWEQLDELEGVFEDIYPDGIDDVNLNDIFYFEPDTVAELLGFEDWEDLMGESVPFEVGLAVAA